MYLTISVNTCGEKCSFGFSAGYEVDYVEFTGLDADEIDEEQDSFEDINYADIENDAMLDWDYIRSMDDGTLEESFWEAMNADPEWEIISLLEALPEYPSLRAMDEKELEELVYEFVTKTLITSEISYELDGIDVTEKVGPGIGDWDDIIFSEITRSVLYQFKKMFV